MEKEKDATQLAWDLFAQTGDIRYYHLYSKLKENK